MDAPLEVMVVRLSVQVTLFGVISTLAETTRAGPSV